MSPGVAELLELLELEPIEHNIYRGQNRDIGTGRIFGGQVLAQALVAARHTVDEARPAHSMHGYFILAGDLDIPVVYFVDRLRDGRSYSTRRVTAIQHGEAIFNMSASFQRPEEGVSHQMPMPPAPPPDELRTELEMIREQADKIPPAVRAAVTRDRLLDIRSVEEEDPFGHERRAPCHRLWMKTVGPLGDDPLLHQAILAYASDYGLLGAALRPHGVTFRDPKVMVASLDHAIWFHRPTRVDEWLLYEVESPSSGGGRGFSRGTFFNQRGELVASVAQEGVVRVRK